MSAKSDLLERLKYIDTAVALPQVIDVGIAPSDHNKVANLLRKGLSIIAFNTLEDYIKNRSAEALNSLPLTTIAFSSLPELLQDLSITGALSSLNFQAKLLQKENPDYKLVIQQETRKISSTNNVQYELSKYSLLSSSSNVSSNEVKDFLSAFGITGGWTSLKSISDAIGGGIPDLAQAFNNASQRRNLSAHSVGFDYNYGWLANLKSEILAICASIDIAISARCRQAQRLPNMQLEHHLLVNDLNFRFLETHGTIFKETRFIGGRSIKNWARFDDAFNHHAPIISSKREFLILLNSNRRIMDWLT